MPDLVDGDATRAQAQDAALSESSDQWRVGLVAPVIPSGKRDGRKRGLHERELMNRVLYALEPGRHWRALPKNLLPNSAEHAYFMLRDFDCTLERVHHALYGMTRDLEAGASSPSADVIDRQSVCAKRGLPKSA